MINKSVIERYSRQILNDNIGLSGMNKIINTSVLIVGVGGLGCPAALYIAAAGIGRIGLLDSDMVDITNLHRQILHRESSVHKAKVESGKDALISINSSCQIETFNVHISSLNANEIISKFDIILDCTDNQVTRYLINDACVTNGKVMISAAALGWNGQLSTYNYSKKMANQANLQNQNGNENENNLQNQNETENNDSHENLHGPCYRCIHPLPPPPATVGSCDTSGVLGPITGIMGSLQALECINVIIDSPNYSGYLLNFSGQTGTFKKLKLRTRKRDCPTCGFKEGKTGEEINSIISPIPMDYFNFCGVRHANDKPVCLNLLESKYRIESLKYFRDIVQNGIDHLLLDVRPENQFELCKLPNSINIPLYKLMELKSFPYSTDSNVIVYCRRGNDSQRAVKLLQSKFKIANSMDIIGGLVSYINQVDNSLPKY